MANILVGDVVGEMALLTHQPSALDIRAGKSGASLLTLQNKDLRKVCPSMPKVVKSLKLCACTERVLLEDLAVSTAFNGHCYTAGCSVP